MPAVPASIRRAPGAVLCGPRLFGAPFIGALCLALMLPAQGARAGEPEAGTPAEREPVAVDRGEASFYGDGFQGRRTASGERFDQAKPTAASKDLPLGTRAEVTHLETGRSVEVTVNDRGPYVEGRIIDLSKQAAKAVGLTKQEGTAPVEVVARPSDQPTEELRRKVLEVARGDEGE